MNEPPPKAGPESSEQTTDAPASDDTLEPEFWRKKTLEEMNRAEWEALCDGCGKCCLLKLEDDDLGKVWYTNVACRLFNHGACRCGDYPRRKERVPQCLVLTPESVRENADWMPRSCAYRLLAEGYDLYAWHPLISGDPDSVHHWRISVRGKTVAEQDVPEDDLLDYIIGEVI